MVVGKPPFEADTPMAIALMHVHEPLPLPRKIKEDIPEAVELIILKALAKDPTDRFQSAGELAKAFSAAIGAESLLTSSHLLELASGAAEGKSSEEVTYDIREEVKRRARTEQRKRLVRLMPFAVAGIVVIGLIGATPWAFNEAQVAQTNSTAIALAATRTASVPTLTPSPTGTPDFNVAVAQVQAATQTQAVILTATDSFLSTRSAQTRSAQQTIIALTPTNTPTNTLTPTPTRTPTNTPAPLPTFTPTPVIVYMSDDGQGRKWCVPDTVKAGRIIFDRAIGRWPSPEEAKAAVGDSWPPITANGQSLTIAGISRSDPQWHTGVGTPGWGFSARVLVQLASGKYEIFSQWLFDVKSCTLTVTN